ATSSSSRARTERHDCPTRRSSDLTEELPPSASTVRGSGVGKGSGVAVMTSSGSLASDAASVSSGGGGVGEASVGSGAAAVGSARSEEHTSELQSRENLVCRLPPEK